MTKQDLINKIAQLESVNDHLLTELSYVDQLMRLVGFAGGLETVKLTAKELYDSEKSSKDRGDSATDEFSF
ncbi:MAG: hypothetical protein ACH350_02735 [Parachlamydiaceae bacterium]